MTGQPFAAALPEVPVEWQSSLQIGINGPREELVGRLEQRVHKMWKLGLVAEVEGLLEHGLRDAKTAKRAIGYAQALAQLDGEMTEVEAIARRVSGPKVVSLVDGTDAASLTMDELQQMGFSVVLYAVTAFAVNRVFALTEQAVRVPGVGATARSEV